MIMEGILTLHEPKISIAGMGKFLCKNRTKKKGALLTFEGISYTTLLLILVAIGILGLGAVEGYRVVSCKWELREISAACIQYKAYSTANKLPTDLSVLVKDDAIASTESTDGVKHGNFLRVSSRWTTGGVNNAWNQPYTISPADGTISCETDALIGTLSTEIGDKDQ